jgi:HEAT repeat protein
MKGIVGRSIRGKASFFVCLLLLHAGFLCQAQPFDLNAVRGIQAFGGSAAARKLLRENGFVVSDPVFKQIFEAYIRSPETEAPSQEHPMGQTLPSFITPDSAWHTYHVLLEEGVKQLEEVQAQRLLQFSRRLLNLTAKNHADPGLVEFASVGLALQDLHYRQSLSEEGKRLVTQLKTGTAPVTVPIGFDLAPLQFRAQSFYTQSSELSDYFAARQWYASVVFRLSNQRETRLALTLAALVHGDPELLKLWRQLSNPYDKLLGTTQDGTVPEYIAVAATVKSGNGFSPTDGQLAEIRKALEARLPLPRINDQLLSPSQYAQFGKVTRGFRLLPPRDLPSAVCFQNTIDPKIPGRMYPSGLDFMAASPVLRSPAALRAVQSEFGNTVSEGILKTDCGPVPDSLHGQALKLLAKLQDPLPTQAPAVFQTQAWSDLQLWTQLGAWAEQRHTWALHAKIAVEYMGMITPPKGMVAPYPDFFAGLGALARQTADEFQQSGMGPQFEVKSIAQKLLDDLNLAKTPFRNRNPQEFEKVSSELEQLSQFQHRYYQQYQKQVEAKGPQEASAVYKTMRQDLEGLARHCATNGEATAAETKTLRMFFDCRQDVVRLLTDFAPVCDRLAGLATKSLHHEALTDEDAKWIEDYGVTLAGFSFYYGNSYEVPKDDFPIVTRVFSNPRTGSMLYAGLARPQALYIIVPNGDQLQLYRGAVMTYREFVRPNDQPLDDQSWRELIAGGHTPPPPAFTHSFLQKKTAADWMRELHSIESGTSSADQDNIFWNLGAVANDQDVPELIQLMAASTNAAEDVTTGLAGIIEQLAWKPYQQHLIVLLSSPDALLSDYAANILLQHPKDLDTASLISDWNIQSARACRLRCVLLSSIPQQTQSSGKALMQLVHNTNAGIRWQAMLAIGDAHWKSEPPLEILSQGLKDTNEFVAAAAAFSSAQLHATNLAPALIACLKDQLHSPQPSVEEQKQQAQAITQGWNRGSRPVGGYGVGWPNVLDPHKLEWRLAINSPPSRSGRRLSAMRLPPRFMNLPTHNYDLTTTLIDALGDLRYLPATNELFKLRATDYESDATRALAKLVPEQLADALIATASNRQEDGYLRGRALVTLGTLGVTNRIQELIPLLNDNSWITYSGVMPEPPAKICDQAAETIAILLGWQDETVARFARPAQREEMLKRVREWAKQIH